MSYAPVRSENVWRPLSGFGPWERNAAETDEVYVWRGIFSGADIRTIEDLQDIARVIGSQQDWGLDLRGVAVKDLGDGRFQVDAAFTSKTPRVYAPSMGFDDAGEIAMKLRTGLASRFGIFNIEAAQLLQFDDEQPIHPAFDFWRFQVPVIYETPFQGKPVPTGAFARFEGLYQGTAEDGINLKPWPRDDKPEPPSPKVEEPEQDNDLVWLAAGALALFAAYRFSKKGTA